MEPAVAATRVVDPEPTPTVSPAPETVDAEPAPDPVMVEPEDERRIADDAAPLTDADATDPGPPALPRRHGAGVEHELASVTVAPEAGPGPGSLGGAPVEPAPSLFSRREDSPEVTPSGLRRRRATEPLPVTPARPMTVDEAGPERDPEAVRATLRRFMTGVGHGRRLAGDPDDTTDPIPTGGGHDE